MISKLIHMAKQEEIPDINISNRVMSEIQKRKGSDVEDRSWKPMGLVAMLSSIAASIIVFFAINTYQEVNDPYLVFFASNPISMEIPVDVLYNQ